MQAGDANINLKFGFIRLIFNFFGHLFAVSLRQGERSALAFSSYSKNMLRRILNLLAIKPKPQVPKLLPLFLIAALLVGCSKKPPETHDEIVKDFSEKLETNKDLFVSYIDSDLDRENGKIILTVQSIYMVNLSTARQAYVSIQETVMSLFNENVAARCTLKVYPVTPQDVDLEIDFSCGGFPSVDKVVTKAYLKNGLVTYELVNASTGTDRETIQETYEDAYKKVFRKDRYAPATLDIDL